MNEEQHNPESVDIDSIPESEMKMPAGTEVVAEEKSSMGIILGVLIVILVLILGGLYLWGTTLQNNTEPAAIERPTAAENNEPESTNAEADVETLQTVSSSDELAAIEADLEATDLDTLDAELQAIEAELDAEFGTDVEAN